MLIKRPVSKAFPVERPIFIVSAPCAGTGPIFELLSRARHVATLNHSARNELRTRLEANDITAEEIRNLVHGLDGRWLSAIVANARQIPLLNEAFPDALFVYVHRNASEQIARMRLDGHAEIAWSETTSRIMNDLAALPARRWCAIDIDQFLSNRPREAALLGRFAGLSWRVKPGPAQKARRRPDAAKSAAIVPALAREAAIFAQANHPSLRDLPAPSHWKENVAKAIVSSRLAAGLTVGAVSLPVAASATTLTVTNNSDTGVSGDGSLRGEIAAASAGDTIAFDSSLNGETITLTGGQIAITVPLTIQGPGSDKLTIDGGGTAADGGLSGGARIFYLYAAIPGVDGGAATPENVTISGLTLQHGHSLTSNGGGIRSDNTNLTLSDVTLQDNQAMYWGGGVVFAHGDAIVVQNSLITGNTVTQSVGGGITLYRTNGTVLLDQVQVTDNQAPGSGAGVYLYNSLGAITIQNSTIAGNSTPPGQEGNGGGLTAENSNFLITGSTISGNTAVNQGGGIQLNGGSTGIIENATLTGNTAGGGGGGIGLYQSGLLLAGTTVSGNTAEAPGGGVLVTYDGATLTMTNSILAGNTSTVDGGTIADDSETDVTGLIASTYSLIQAPGQATFIDSDGGMSDAGGMVLGEGNITGEDPRLGALADNGGPTKTMLPGTGSPAINAGDPNFPGDWPAALSDAGIAAPTIDQRGLTRVANGRIDMGAVEVQPPDAGTDAGAVETSDAGTRTTAGKGCNCNGTSDAALALLTPIGLLLMRRRRRAS